MLLGTLASTLLENMLAGKGIVRVGYGSSIKKSSNSTVSFNKSIIKMSLDLMVFILEITYLKKWSICRKKKMNMQMLCHIGFLCM